MNPRLVRAASDLAMSESCGWQSGLGSMFDRRADAHVSAAPADVSRHGGVDIGILRMRRGVEQSRCRHDLPGLAVAALDHLQIQPCLLHFGAGRRGAHAFDGGDGSPADRAYCEEAGPYRRAIYMHGAGPALRYAAAEL